MTERTSKVSNKIWKTQTKKKHLTSLPNWPQSLRLYSDPSNRILSGVFISASPFPRCRNISPFQWKFVSISFEIFLKFFKYLIVSCFVFSLMCHFLLRILIFNQFYVPWLVIKNLDFKLFFSLLISRSSVNIHSQADPNALQSFTKQ